ncbi:MAG TPA: glycosyltransferase family 4 protein [Thermoanaerobaculia bacterium]|jgi:glycosyltransferase involved in cell wall biosynthesis|nr:glycosyltransferase family 4 protein [Thermoanaerobaculia bacterium]
MRVAFFSPLPPMKSGIADYSAELLPYLAEECEVELIVDEGLRPDPALAGRFAVHGHRALPRLLAEGRFDVVLYQLGNNPDYHATVYRTLLEHPGVVVLHEYVIHHMVRELTLHAGRPDEYVREMRYAYGRTGEAGARRCVATGVPLDPWSYPLFERVVDASLGTIVHNGFTRDRVLASRPLARVATVPHHLSLDFPGGKGGPEEARAALGIAPDEFVVATFGFLTAAKRPEVLLRAFARLRRGFPRARFLIVGEVSPHFDFARVFTSELREGVAITGRLDLDRFLLHMQACDVAVNLRHPTAGETSGTVIRLLGLGKPVIVNDTGAFAEIPDDCCAKVDLDDTEEELLLAYLRALAGDEALRRRLGENARRHMALHHTLAGSARGYADFLRETVAMNVQPFRAVPPLAAYPEDDLLSDLVREVTAEMVDLGIGEEEDDLLREVSAAMVELDLDRT